ncbi:MAG: ribosome small subunit-dependent GTPase A [Pseudomonadales bacterium]|nr:ribosome small subunit-dependent GTPase A [Pseudomonadales bacterium]MBO6595193.1 ribosome small subunit-dependent GTPase A [Pseudomonadales bacterium]MBO6701699.1 ribosome small subunit-dependent GTPase A [Pseudomonadales bacterium]MBO6821248.1 ribosome small subunit-dependent GTPase A [Pseudomonadales bacterium]MBO7006657.1 ribosome small subunit-dependent GTPase A [Pseudomonadales bacterium]
MVEITELGWNHFFQQQLVETDPSCKPARVVRQDMNQYHLLSDDGNLIGVIPGRVRKAALSKADLPTVGDWVVYSHIEGAEAGTVQIEKCLDRKSKFSRKEAGEVVDEQIVASNIDTVFIVSGLDDDFNPNRIERYLLLSWDSGANPVIVLNKADLCDNLEERLKELESIAMGAPVHVMSALDKAGTEVLLNYVKPGTTCAFMGSSGVGKSTLINLLLGYERFATGAVRDDDSKGRHTTTFRELVLTESGAMIIDTPGMREIQVWADSASLSQTFEDIEEIAIHCKFNDCQHNQEPGCAIREAIENGSLDRERLDRYYKLKREVAHVESQQTAAARAAKKEERKRFSNKVRKLPNKRD